MSATINAELAPEVSKFLSTSTATAKLPVIVSFKSATGVQKLSGMLGSVERLKSAPIAFAKLSAAQIRTVASWSVTRSVFGNRTYKLLDDVANREIHADKVQSGYRLKQPYNGAGVGVAIVDSGVDATQAPGGEHSAHAQIDQCKRGIAVGKRTVRPEQPEAQQQDREHQATIELHGTPSFACGSAGLGNRPAIQI